MRSDARTASSVSSHPSVTRVSLLSTTACPSHSARPRFAVPTKPRLRAFSSRTTRCRRPGTRAASAASPDPARSRPPGRAARARSRVREHRLDAAPGERDVAVDGNDDVCAGGCVGGDRSHAVCQGAKASRTRLGAFACTMPHNPFQVMRLCLVAHERARRARQRAAARMVELAAFLVAAGHEVRHHFGNRLAGRRALAPQGIVWTCGSLVTSPRPSLISRARSPSKPAMTLNSARMPVETESHSAERELEHLLEVERGRFERRGRFRALVETVSELRDWKHLEGVLKSPLQGTSGVQFDAPNDVAWAHRDPLCPPRPSPLPSGVARHPCGRRVPSRSKARL